MPQKRVRSGKTRWVGRYRDPAGKERSRTFDTRREAQAWEHEREREIRRGEWVDPRGAPTIEQLVREYEALAVKPGTRRDRYQLRINLGDLGAMPVTSVRRSHLEQWALQLRDGRPWAGGAPLSPSAVQVRVGMMRTLLSRAVADGLIAVNPGDVLKRFPVGGSSEIVVPTVDQVRALVEHAPAPWFRLAVMIAAETGLRAGEVCGLRVRDVDVMRRVIHVRVQSGERAGDPLRDLKSRDSRRDVPIGEGLALDIARALEGRGGDQDARVLVSERGLPLFSSRISQTMARARREAGVPGEVHFHCLRHFYASRMLAAGVPLPTVSAMLGHSSPAVTARIYSHHLPDQWDAARAGVDAVAGLVRDGGGLGGRPAVTV